MLDQDKMKTICNKYVECIRCETSDKACLLTRYAEGDAMKEILRYLMPKPCRVTQAWRCRAAHKSWYRSASGQMSGCTREVDPRQSVRSSIITEYFSAIW